MLDQAFNFNNSHLRDYLSDALGTGRQINSRNLPLRDARDLLAMSHVIEAAAVNQSGAAELQVKFTGEIASNDYFTEFDEYILELKNSD